MMCSLKMQTTGVCKVNCPNCNTVCYTLIKNPCFNMSAKITFNVTLHFLNIQLNACLYYCYIIFNIGISLEKRTTFLWQPIFDTLAVTQLNAGTWPGSTQPAFWTGSFLKNLFLDRQKLLWRNFNFHFLGEVTMSFPNKPSSKTWLKCKLP